jgi:signal transduction histidine kinase
MMGARWPALVQRLAQLHGGEVEGDTELGAGSRFSPSLPLTGS